MRICTGIAILLTTAVGLYKAPGNIITFNDLTTGSGVPALYQGFGWTGWDIEDGASYQTVYANSYGGSSANKFAYNAFGVMTVTTTGGTLFDFNGADVSTWAGNNTYQSFSSHTLTVKGYNGATLVGSATVNLSSTQFSPLVANFVGINKLEFSNDGIDGHWWLLDNLQYNAPVPEPTTMIAGALLLLPFGASTIRFMRKNRAA